ncbi:MAG: PD40 domain-containing protein [Bacteroidales bacterium]|nr:PD40 domain-containing protein [Bacteroidales bacterium]
MTPHHLHQKLKIFSFLCLALVFYPNYAQVRVTDAELRSHVQYLKNDTLPIDIQLLNKIINTPYSEYNALLFPDSTFYFSSLRPESEEDNDHYFSPFWSTRIYQSQLTIGGYSKQQALPRIINDDHYYNCNFTFNQTRTILVFSRCERESGKELQCSLWSSEKNHGHWSKPKILNRRINLPGSTTTQPCWVDYEDFSVMYFVSNRPKGYGDLDIWYTIYKNNHFEDPINAGSKINTKDNEITPFYDKKNNKIYFSTDNPHLSIGGYDIFQAVGNMSQWEQVSNMGVPINSEANDFYLSVNQHNNDGFFVSNRPQKKEDDADTCCSDIYSFHLIAEEDTNPEQLSETDTITTMEKIEVLLPITLYFHNDEPDPRTTQTTTQQNYQATLANYLALKETYRTEYAKGLKGESYIQAQNDIEQFFADSVEQGFRKLEEFSSLLIYHLTEGYTVTIDVCGFASPLHKSDYNLYLSSRRIDSFVNYLKEYKNGLFLPYLEKGKIIIQRIPEGSSLAHKGVSNNLNDKRNSVYSIAASRERKIQVSRYVISKDHETN